LSGYPFQHDFSPLRPGGNSIIPDLTFNVAGGSLKAKDFANVSDAQQVAEEWPTMDCLLWSTLPFFKHKLGPYGTGSCAQGHGSKCLWHSIGQNEILPET
jgi:hypothetical protein